MDINGSQDAPSFHYGWIVVFAGMLGIFACLGLGRFAFGMILPSMGESLALSYAEMGWISTANFLGYLGAVVLAGRLAALTGARLGIFAGLVLVAGSMAALSRASGFEVALALYVLTGIGSGFANVLIMALLPHWFLRRFRGRASGFVVTGSGFAILLTGFLVPEVNQALGAEGWRTNWLTLGIIAGVVALVAGGLIRNDPAALGLQPVGQDAAAPPPAHPAKGGKGVILHLGAIYFLFGASYVIYVTFIVTALVEDRGFAEETAGHFWSWVGALSLISGPLFGTLSDKLGRKAGLMMVFVLQACAYLFVATDLPEVFLYASIGLFGICAWSIPGIMGAAVGDYMGPQKAAAAFGAITVMFGIGQTAGPAVAGAMAEVQGSFAGSFALAGVLALSAVLLSLFLQKPAHS